MKSTPASTPNGAAADIEFTLGINGYLQQELWFDPSPGTRLIPVPVTQTDAYSVMQHEFGHAFGFNGWRDGNTGALPGDYLSTFDALVTPQALPAAARSSISPARRPVRSTAAPCR